MKVLCQMFRLQAKPGCRGDERELQDLWVSCHLARRSSCSNHCQCAVEIWLLVVDSCQESPKLHGSPEAVVEEEEP